MTSQGTAHGRFSRALASRNLRGAEAAARELGWLALEDALGLCVLYFQCAPAQYERAAVRWLERFIAEKRPSLEDVGLAVAPFHPPAGVGFEPRATFSSAPARGTSLSLGWVTPRRSSASTTAPSAPRAFERRAVVGSQGFGSSLLGNARRTSARSALYPA
jgi:hypothetical protein